MPLDHSRRFDEYQGFEDLRPHSVKPNPQEPVGGKEPKSVTALPAQDDHLMSQCDKLELQRRSASKTERDEGDESEQDRNHATRGYGHAPRKLRLPRCFHNFEQGQA